MIHQTFQCELAERDKLWIVGANGAIPSVTCIGNEHKVGIYSSSRQFLDELLAFLAERISLSGRYKDGRESVRVGKEGGETGVLWVSALGNVAAIEEEPGTPAECPTRGFARDVRLVHPLFVGETATRKVSRGIEGGDGLDCALWEGGRGGESEVTASRLATDGDPRGIELVGAGEDPAKDVEDVKQGGREWMLGGLGIVSVDHDTVEGVGDELTELCVCAEAGQDESAAMHVDMDREGAMCRG